MDLVRAGFVSQVFLMGQRLHVHRKVGTTSAEPREMISWRQPLSLGTGEAGWVLTTVLIPPSSCALSTALGAWDAFFRLTWKQRQDKVKRIKEDLFIEGPSGTQRADKASQEVTPKMKDGHKFLIQI